MTWTRHENGVGATPTFGRRRRRRRNVRGGGAASHSSTVNRLETRSRGLIRTGFGLSNGIRPYWCYCTRSAGRRMSGVACGWFEVGIIRRPQRCSWGIHRLQERISAATEQLSSRSASAKDSAADCPLSRQRVEHQASSVLPYAYLFISVYQQDCIYVVHNNNSSRTAAAAVVVVVVAKKHNKNCKYTKKGTFTKIN